MSNRLRRALSGGLPEGGKVQEPSGHGQDPALLNYGNGYIPWAIKRDGGYTVANAIAFSNMQARWLIECGLLLCYDDKRNSKHE